MTGFKRLTRKILAQWNHSACTDVSVYSSCRVFLLRLLGRARGATRVDSSIDPRVFAAVNKRTTAGEAPPPLLLFLAAKNFARCLFIRLTRVW